MSLTRVAIYGAYGYTGSRVAAELSRRGFSLVLCGRSESALRKVAAGLETRTEVRPASVEDAAALRAALRGCFAVVNCAGPFLDTGKALIAAALAERVHYLDVSAEQAHIHRVFEVYDAAARDAGVALLPSMAFYSAPADLFAHLVAAGMGPLKEITVAYAVRGWRMTRASRITTVKFIRERSRYVGGRLRHMSRMVWIGLHRFPPPVGRKRVILDYPLAEPVTIPRHIQTQRVRCLMSTEAFADGAIVGVIAFLGNFVPLLGARLRAFMRERPDPAAELIAATDFTIEVVARNARGRRSGTLSGRDIYGISATIVGEAVQQLLGMQSTPAGALSPAEAFEPAAFLDRLVVCGLRYRVEDVASVSV